MEITSIIEHAKAGGNALEVGSLKGAPRPEEEGYWDGVVEKQKRGCGIPGDVLFWRDEVEDGGVPPPEPPRRQRSEVEKAGLKRTGYAHPGASREREPALSVEQGERQ